MHEGFLRQDKGKVLQRKSLEIFFFIISLKLIKEESGEEKQKQNETNPQHTKMNYKYKDENCTQEYEKNAAQEMMFWNDYQLPTR